jgi:DNA replication protein DnaC
MEYMKTKRNFLILTGAPGCGKTHIVAAMMEWIMTEFNHFRVWKEYDLMMKVKQKIDCGWDATQTLLTLIDDDVVVIDDIASQGHNEWREKMMFELIDIRYNSTKPTIFTTNLSEKDFLRRYEPRIADRLFAQENTIIDLHNEPSLRKQGM